MYQQLFAKTASEIESVSLKPITFGEAKSTETGAMGSWADAFRKNYFSKPPSQIKTIKKDVGENARAFSFGRTQSISVLITSDHQKPTCYLFLEPPEILYSNDSQKSLLTIVSPINGKADMLSPRRTPQ